MATVTHTITGTVRDSHGAMSSYLSSYLSTSSAWSALDGRLNAPGDTGNALYTLFFNPASIATPVANPLAAYHAAAHPDIRVFDNWLPGGSPSVVSNSVYINQPPWQVAGIDYPVGIRPAFLPLKTNIVAVPPAGCTITANASGFQLNVNSNNVTVQGYDMSVSGGVNVWVPSPATTGTLVSDCYFKMQSTNTTDCIDGNNSQITVQYCAIDGNNISTTTASTTQRLWKVSYIFIQNTQQDTFNYGANQTSDPTTQGFFIQFSVILNGGVGDGHADWLQVGGPPSAGFPWNMNSTFCTYWAQGAAAPFGGNAGTQGWILAGQTNAPVCGLFNNNTAITALDTNSGKPVSHVAYVSNLGTDSSIVSPGIQFQWNYIDQTGSSGTITVTGSNPGGGLLIVKNNLDMVTGNIDVAAGFPVFS